MIKYYLFSKGGNMKKSLLGFLVCLMIIPLAFGLSACNFMSHNDNKDVVATAPSQVQNIQSEWITSTSLNKCVALQFTWEEPETKGDGYGGIQYEYSCTDSINTSFIRSGTTTEQSVVLDFIYCNNQTCYFTVKAFRVGIQNQEPYNKYGTPNSESILLPYCPLVANDTNSVHVNSNSEGVFVSWNYDRIVFPSNIIRFELSAYHFENNTPPPLYTTILPATASTESLLYQLTERLNEVTLVGLFYVVKNNKNNEVRICQGSARYYGY